MADVTTISNVVQITVRDSDNNRRSFNLQEPRTNITIQEIRTIFEPLINSGKWFSPSNKPITYVENAVLTKTKKIELGEETTIEVTPSEGRIEQYNPGIASVTFTVSGSPIMGYNYISTSGNPYTEAYPAEIDANANTIKAVFNIKSVSNIMATYDFEIITAAGKLMVPISIKTQ